MPYVFPTNREINVINPVKTAASMSAMTLFDIMPVRNVNAATVDWIQKDNDRGLQQLRGLDGAPAHVKRIGDKHYSYDPGVFGEFITITETELTKRAGGIAPDAIDRVPIDVGDLVMDANDTLLGRELARIQQIGWALLTTGTFSIAAPAGGVIFTDTFPLQTFLRSVAWTTAATSIPLGDLRAVKLLSFGKGTNFNGKAKIYMNSVTLNYALGNTNSADLGGRRVEAGNTVQDLTRINAISLANDLPQIVVCDDAYNDDTDTAQYFIPTGTFVLVGSRPDGSKVAEYLMTRNAVNPGFAPGSYTLVKDHTGNGPDGQRRVPTIIEVHRGHNGGPVCYFPGSIVVGTVN